MFGDFGYTYPMDYEDWPAAGLVDTLLS